MFVRGKTIILYFDKFRLLSDSLRSIFLTKIPLITRGFWYPFHPQLQQGKLIYPRSRSSNVATEYISQPVNLGECTITQYCFVLGAYIYVMSSGLLIYQHLSQVYPETRLTAKLHFMVHYGEQTRRHGPLIHFWCMRYESKHRLAKQTASVSCE